jgi:hypothetical protein
MTDLDLSQVKRLVRELDSDDAFSRRDAIEQLAILTQQRLDYRWSAGSEERQRAVRRWKRWIAREERARRGKQVTTTIEILTGGQIDKEALDAALQSLPAAQKKALMAKVLAKVTAQHAGAQSLPTCEHCQRRPATASVTQLETDGSYANQRLCEVCAHREGG